MQQGRPVPYDFRADRSSTAGGHDRHQGRTGSKVQENRRQLHVQHGGALQIRAEQQARSLANIPG